MKKTDWVASNRIPDWLSYAFGKNNSQALFTGVEMKETDWVASNRIPDFLVTGTFRSENNTAVQTRGYAGRRT